MTKYLFNDGTNQIQEVHSREDLDKLAAPADPQRASVWVFPSDEWMSLARFRALYPAVQQGQTTVARQDQRPEAPVMPPPRKGLAMGWKLLMGAVITAGILLIYNFTQHNWERIPDLTVRPERPENSPPINIDSLVATIEAARSTRLDKVTRTNLRIRNSWPEQILLSLKTERESSSSGIRYHSLQFTLDNATGYQLDEVEAEMSIWRNGMVDRKETVTFEKVNYTEPGKRTIDGQFVGDSISVRVLQAKAKSFNFCYSHDKQSNYGNLNDRWFCR